MKFPKLNKGGLHRLELHNFSGGLNTSLAPHLIGINEQSEINNMFFCDGVLKKRPAFKKLLSLDGYTVSNIKALEGQFVYKFIVDDFGRGLFTAAFINDKGELTEVGTIDIKEEYEFNEGLNEKICYTVFPFYSNGIIYICFGYKDQKGNFLSKLYKCENKEITLIADDEIYAPLILINGKGNKFSSLPIGENTIYSPQISFEGVNLLTKRVRATYTTDGSSFSFPFLAARKAGTPVKVRLTGAFNQGDSIEEFEFTINQDNEIINISNKGCCFISNYQNLTFRKSDNSPNPPIAASYSNNLEIEYYLEENKNAKSFFEMNIFTSFGGTKGGGGNRIFVTGNKNEKNLLRWSDINNPLYFPENNYAYVSDGEIKALKKQGNMLIIFSDNEIHYTTYLSGSYSAEELINGEIPDVTAISALFPIYQLHSELGLHSKDSVLLKDNKILFLGNDKKIYRIENGNKITHISKKIDSFLKGKEILNAVAGRYLNYFLLFTNCGIIAYNTENNGFYIWKEFFNAKTIFADEEAPIIVADDGVYTVSRDEDFEFDFTTFETDLYYPDKFKKLCKILVTADGGEISVLTRGEREILRKITPHTPIFINLPKAKRFKFRLKNCNNIESIIIYYTIY